MLPPDSTEIESSTPVDAVLVTSEDLPMHQLAPQHVQAERLGNLIGSAMLAIPLLIGLAVMWFALGVGLPFYLAFAGYMTLLMLLAYSCFIWPQLAFRNTFWRMSDECLEIHRGVFWKHRIVIPLGRVQHADVAQGPLLRYFDLGKLIIHTAGTSNATIELNGLNHQDAMRLRDQLVQQTQSKSVL